MCIKMVKHFIWVSLKSIPTCHSVYQISQLTYMLNLMNLKHENVKLIQNIKHQVPRFYFLNRFHLLSNRFHVCLGEGICARIPPDKFAFRLCACAVAEDPALRCSIHVLVIAHTHTTYDMNIFVCYLSVKFYSFTTGICNIYIQLQKVRSDNRHINTGLVQCKNCSFIVGHM